MKTLNKEQLNAVSGGDKIIYVGRCHSDDKSPTYRDGGIHYDGYFGHTGWQDTEEDAIKFCFERGADYVKVHKLDGSFVGEYRWFVCG